MIYVCKTFLLFIVYSILGWTMEMISCYIRTKKLVDRGYLIGPYCPIYGFGATLIVLLLEKYLNDPIILFIMAMLICSVLEYMTSYFMEKIFKARWWDYSNRKLNINGRICIENSIAFGLIGIALIYYINPFFEKIVDGFSLNVIYVSSLVIFFVFSADYIVSSKLMLSFKDALLSLNKDNTEEITERVKSILMEKSVFTRRIIKAFPNVKVRIDMIKEKINMQKEKLIQEIERINIK